MLPSNTHLRDEVAAFAARLIAEDGLDYASAKRRAVRDLIGDERRAPSDCVPDNAMVEDAVRAHQALFMADTQPARLLALRRTALDVMRFLESFEPVACGAIVNGTAGEHSDVHLQIHTDNAKDVEIFLLNAGIDFDASEGEGSHGAPARDGNEMLRFAWPPRTPVARAQGAHFAVDDEVVHLALLDPRDRGTTRGTKLARADIHALEALIAAASEADPPSEATR